MTDEPKTLETTIVTKIEEATTTSTDQVKLNSIKQALITRHKIG